MIVDEEVQETRVVRMIRCDKCLKAIRDSYDREHMGVATLNGFVRQEDKGRIVQKGRYHLCCECVFSMQYEFDENRKHWKEKCCVTNEEQSALFDGLFPAPQKKGVMHKVFGGRK